MFTHYFQLSANSSLTESQFQNASLIITMFMYQLPSTCSVNNRLEWPLLSYSYFVDRLMATPGVNSPTNYTTAFTVDQLEQLLRTISDSYIPGNRPIAEVNTSRPEDVSTMCAVGNTRVWVTLVYLFYFSQTERRRLCDMC